MASSYEYALMAGNSYRQARSISENTLPVPLGWEQISGTDINDPDSGFLARAYRNSSTGQIVIAYAGTTSAEDWSNGNIPAWLGSGPEAIQVAQAMALYEEIRDQNPEADISFTGHSLGGGLASLMAVYFNRPAVVFDSAPFEASAKRASALDDAHYERTGEHYSDDPEYLDYISNSSYYYEGRRGLVQDIATTGEVLSFLLFPGRRIGTPTEFHNPGAQWYGETINLHSQTLLAAMLVCPTFENIAPKLPGLLRSIFDPELFFNDPTDRNQTKTNLLEHLVTREIGDASRGVLDSDLLTHFTNDLAKIASFYSDSQAQLFDGLIKLLLQHYYQSSSFKKELFNQSSIEVEGGVQFDLTDSLGDSTNLLPEIKGYVDLKEYVSSVLGPDAMQYLDEARNWFVSLGAQSLIARSGENMADFMLGGQRTDRLDAGNGEDVLVGHGGMDLLAGGRGDDVLIGGEGQDLYFWVEGDGNDNILDEDGGRLLIERGQNRFALAGVLQKQYGADSWKSADGQLALRHGSTWKLSLDSGSTIDFGETFNPDLWGISLVETPGQTETTNTISGDLAPLDAKPSEPGIQYFYDELGNVITTAEPEIDREDFLYDSGDADLIKAGGGDDRVLAVRGGDDHIQLGAGQDYSEGGAGNDIVEGGADSDILYGGLGDDTLYANEIIDVSAAITTGNAGNGSGQHGDWLSGGAGGDTLVAGADDDVLVGGSGSDLLLGGAGNDNLIGDSDWVAQSFDWTYIDSPAPPGGREGRREFEPVLNGGNSSDDSADTFYGGRGDDWIRGGRGDDLAYGDGEDDDIAGEWGNDILIGGDGNDRIAGDATYMANDAEHGNDYLDGGDGNDELAGNGGHDVLLGGAGEDTLFGDDGFVAGPFQGDDYLDGGEGNDYLDGGGGNDVLVGGKDNDTLYGRDGEDVLSGGEGGDYIDGGDGDDILIGGAGADVLIGGSGNDVIVASLYDGDVVVDEDGVNTVQIDYAGDFANLAISQTVDADDGTAYLVLNDDVGHELIIKNGFAGAIAEFDFGDGQTVSRHELMRALDTATLSITATDKSEHIIVGNSSDTVDAAGGNDVVEGLGGDDALTGGIGDDTLIGGAGNDTLQGGQGSDVYAYQPGDGYDAIYDSGGEQDVLRFGEGISFGSLYLDRSGSDLRIGIDDGYDDGEILIRGQYDDPESRIEAIEFADGARYTEGGAESEIIEGTVGNDIIVGADGNDVLYGLDGDDVLYGEYERYYEAGGGEEYAYAAYGAAARGEYDGDDNTPSTDHDDVLVGGAGNDTLDGGFAPDHDILQGGPGDDTYIFRTGSGEDEIIESEDIGNADRILLEDLWPGDVKLERDESDLILTTWNDDRLIVRDFFVRADAVVEKIIFADGMELDYDGIVDALTQGTPEDDRLIGVERGDYIAGGEGNDILEGRAGDDILDGGRGDDVLEGGTGDDTYHFSRGGGVDRIIQRAGDGIDTIRLSEDVAPADVIVTRDETDLIIAIRGTSDRVHVRDWHVDPGARVDRLQFSDGTVWGREQLDALSSVMPAASQFSDVLGGTVGDDLIEGLDGDDAIFALQGNDILDGGSGDDLLMGGTGSDTYRLGPGSGHDAIVERDGTDDVDAIELAPGLSPADVRITRNETDLKIILRGTGESLTIRGWYVEAAARIEALRFADGTVWDSATLELRANAPSDENDFIVGDASGNVLAGGWGDDILLGLNGNDVLVGGGGNDDLRGGEGDDVYVIERGGPQYDVVTDAGGFDVVRFAPGITADQVIVQYDDYGELYLSVFGGGSEIEVVGGDFDYGEAENQIERVEFADGTIWDAETLASFRVTRTTTRGDYIEGSTRDDPIDGLGGGDWVDGGAGSDRYYYNAGYGALYIEDGGSPDDVDTVVFGAGIDPASLVVTRTRYDLRVALNDSDAIVLSSHFLSPAIERFEFADGTVLTIGDIEQSQIVATGTGSSETIYGSVGNDVMRGLDGNDQLYGDRGDDDIDGGVHDDSIYGEAGDDTLSGGAGIDRVYGGDGNDVLTGGINSNDDMRWESDNRYGYWSGRADRLDGGAGDDVYVMHAGDGYDVIAASEGVDTLRLADGLSAEDVVISLQTSSYEPGRQSFNFGPGTAYGSPGAIERIESADGLVITQDQFASYQLATIDGTGGNDSIIGNLGPNNINAGGGNDLVHAGGGRDTVFGGYGDDLLFGGSGSDTISDYDGENMLFGEAGDDSLSGRGILSGGAGDDWLSGSGVLDGGAGDDRLNVSPGATVVFGRGYGHDVITSSNAFSVVLGPGIRPQDLIVTGLVHDRFTDPLAIRIDGSGDSLQGLDGVTRIAFEDGTIWTESDLRVRAHIHATTADADAVAGTAEADVLEGGNGNDLLGGNAGDDVLHGGAGHDMLYGDAGDDVLDGGDGPDTIWGGVGDDVMFGGIDSESETDYLYGEAGTDTYRLERGIGSDVVLEPSNNDELSIIAVGAGLAPEDVEITHDSGGFGFRIAGTPDNLYFSSWTAGEYSRGRLEVRFADGVVWTDAEIVSRAVPGSYVAGTLGNDIIEAGSGNRTVYAREGDDRVIGGDGADTLYGHDGSDHLSGGDGRDRLYGGSGNDTLDGGEGDDELYGAEGDDVLDGRAGADVLDGGAGADTFRFGFGSGSDTVMATGVDVLAFGAGVTRADVRLAAEGSDLIIGLQGADDVLRVSGWGYKADRLSVARFDDGTQWRFADRITPLLGTTANDYISAAEASPYNDVIYGLDGNDTLNGGAGDDRIFGGAGSDTLVGGPGADLLDGGFGNDWVTLDADDTIVFGRDSGTDTLSSTLAGAVRFEGNVRPEDVTFSYFQASEAYGSDASIGDFTIQFGISIRGGSAQLNGFGAQIDGTGNPNIGYRFEFAGGTVWEGSDLLERVQLYVQGSGSHNALVGAAGNDVLRVASETVAIGGAGDDTLIGGTGADRLLGGTGDDVLRGGAGNDRLMGAAGDDLIEGGSGNDVMFGEAGANTYRFDAGFGQDVVNLGSTADRFMFAGIRPDQIGIVMSGSQLTFTLAGTSDTVAVRNAVAQTENGLEVRFSDVRFDDGARWDAKEIVRRLNQATAGDDQLVGSSHGQVIDGGAGNDSISAHDGQDLLRGGAGNDVLYGGTDSDLLDGGTGDDVLRGSAGGDLYVFGRGYGHDVVIDGDSTPRNVDTILVDVASNELAMGHAGNEVVMTIIDTGETLTIQGGNEALAIERIRFADGVVLDPDTWGARMSTVALESDAGELIIAPDERFDTLVIGAGIDAEALSMARDGADLTIGAGAGSVRLSGWFDRPAAPGVLQLRFHDGTLLDFRELSRLALETHGGAGDETLQALEGFAAHLDGGAGNDGLFGADQDDVLSGGVGNDYLDGGAGNDLVWGGEGDDVYVIDSAGDVAIEEADGGIDTLRMVPFSNVVTLPVGFENLELMGGGAVTMIGNDADNRLVGNAAANRLEGGAGNDLLDGGAGADTLVGGIGNDVYIVDNSGESIVEAADEGNDTVRSSVSFALTNAALENLELLGSSNINATGNDGDNRLVGNAGRNVLTGGAGSDYLDGGPQDDVMRGGTGDDVYIVDHAADQVSEDAGAGLDEVRASASCTLSNNVENLVLAGDASINGTGNALANRLSGNAGDNVLSGGGGDDRLDGGAGNDTLKGGTGADTYVFGRGSGVDTVIEQDAAVALDAIEIGAGLSPGDLSFQWNGSDLIIAVIDGTDRLIVKNFKQASGAIEQLRFVSGGQVWDSASINAAANGAPVNQTPTLQRPICEQTATAGASFRYGISVETFTDADVGDRLSLSASLSDGAPLPSWLSFDATTGEFSGTPKVGDVGALSIRVTATDWANVSIADVFELSIGLSEDTSPSVVMPLSDQSVVPQQFFSFEVPSGAFFDPDTGDSLTLSARLNSGEALPEWIRFDAARRTFSGTPPRTTAGAIAITVTATDMRGRAASDSWMLSVQDVNDAPMAHHLIADQVLGQGGAIDVEIPADVFVDPEGDAITLSVGLADGSPLPDWLHYDSAARRITGTAVADAVGTTTIRVHAIDATGLSGHDDFNIVVGDENDAPVVANPIADQRATEAGDFRFRIPSDAFADIDEGDVMTYSVAVVDAPSHARSYFLYDAYSREIYRTGGSGKFDYWDVGEWTLRVRAEDQLNLSTYDDFTLHVEAAGINHAPVIASDDALWNPVRYSAGSTQDLPAHAGIDIALQLPLLSNVETAPGYTGTHFADVDGDTLAYTVSPINENPVQHWTLNVQTGTLSFQAIDATRTYEWHVQATDAAGASASYAYMLTLNQQPTIGVIPGITIMEDETMTFTVPDGIVVDPDGDSMDYQAGGLTYYHPQLGTVSWGSFDPWTRTFTFTPDDYAVGNRTVALSVRDSYSQYVTTAFNVTVLNAYDAPRLAQPIVDVQATEDSTLSINAAIAFQIVDSGQTLVYEAKLANGEVLPAWLSFDTSTGRFSGKPRQSDIGTSTIVVTARDAAGSAISDTFDLNVVLADRNHAPYVANPLADQIYRKQQSFQFQMPAGAFEDVDANETLSFRATLESGQPLPSWLVFDTATQTFSGTLPPGHTAPTSIKVYARDKAGAESFDVFSIVVDTGNAPPTVTTPLVSQSTPEDVAFIFTVPGETFTDPEGGGLIYSAARIDGTALPDWLNFDESTRTFNGIPGNADVGALDVRLTATDAFGAATSDTFTLTVLNVNDAPMLVQSPGDRGTIEGAVFSFAVPEAFSDIDAGDTLTYSAMLADDSALPDWLHFDAATRTFSGVAGTPGTLALKIVATDKAGASASAFFSLAIVEGNHPPGLALPIEDRAALEDEAFIFTLPTGSFIDADAGDALSYSATLADGSTLPDWLQFDTRTGTFSGVPGNGDVGTLSIKVTASDGAGARASDTFDLAILNANDTPTVAHALADQTATEDMPFEFTISAAGFTDVDAGDTLTYTATLGDGSALPGWLSFDAATGTFLGTPENSDVGVLSVTVTVTDGAGAQASDMFQLTVLDTNDAPTLLNALAGQTTTENEFFSFVVPVDAFDDVDVGDALTYTAVLADGSPLPEWLTFDTATRTFSGTPPDGTARNVSVAIVATDRSGAQVTGGFALTVREGDDGCVGITLIGTKRDDILVGTACDDVLDGKAGSDKMIGGEGDDVYYVDQAPSSDDEDEEEDDDDGDDDDDEVENDDDDGDDEDDDDDGDDDADEGISGDRVIESIDAGFDTVYSSVSYALPANVEGLVLAGTAQLDGTGNALNNWLRGNGAANTLNGGTGNDLLEGGAGNDRLTNASGAAYLNGGPGADTITGKGRAEIFLGGQGDDNVMTGDGADIIVFNRGDGADVVSGGVGTDNAVSLGGGIRYEDLRLSKSSSDLILEIGTESMKFKDWYRSSANYKSIKTLQIIAAASADYDPYSGDPLLDDQVEQFDFAGLVGAFDQARAANPSLTKWALTNALTAYHLEATSGDTAALGGDLAYYYGENGSVAGMNVSAAQDVIGSADLGVRNQSLRLFDGVSGGSATLS